MKAEDCQPSAEVEVRPGQFPPPENMRKQGCANTLTSDVWSPECEKEVSVAFSHPASGTLLWQPLETVTLPSTHLLSKPLFFP